jgi:predicted metal-dependent enzyme (double-stranded beta helix superfamily)
MSKQDWFVNKEGDYQVCQTAREWDLLRENYRLYRFLTELEDVLNDVDDESTRLPEIRMLVRRLLVNSYWVRSRFLDAGSHGTSVLNLYDELGFQFTIQTVTFAPGTKSNIHNHGTWGIVGILKGQEKNTIWKRSATDNFQGRVEQTGELMLFPGDIISFAPDAIHCVEAVGDEPTVTFNLYGETDPSRRFEFDVVTHVAKRY